MPFRAKLPKDRNELHTCVLMLEESSYYQYRSKSLTIERIEEVFVDLLSSGKGQIIIMRNPDYDNRLFSPKYSHKFCSFHVVAYVTREFMRSIIEQRDISDIGMYFVENYENYLRQGKPDVLSPVVTEPIRTKSEGEGLCCLSLFFVRHPNLRLDDTLRMRVSNEYSLRLREATQIIFGGLPYDIWVHNPYGYFAMKAYLDAGHNLLREYPGNKPFNLLNIPDLLERKYLLCMVRDRQVADEFNIDESCILPITSWYTDCFFSIKTNRVRLTPKQQEYCYWLALGCENHHIAQIMKANRNDLAGYQNGAFQRFSDAGLAFSVDNAQWKLRELIRRYLHEVKTVTYPLFPFLEDFPEEFFL